MFSSLPYMLFFVVGGLSTRYYFTPLYPLVIPVLLAYAPWRTSRAFKLLTAAAALVFAFNVLPGGVATLASIKNQQAVYARAMDYVTGLVRQGEAERPVTMALYGGHVRNVRSWLEYRGLPTAAWSIDNRRDAVPAKARELDALAADADVVIVARDSALALRPDLLKALAERYTTARTFEDPFPVGDVSLANLARMAAFRLQGGTGGRYYPLSGMAGYIVFSRP